MNHLSDLRIKIPSASAFIRMLSSTHVKILIAIGVVGLLVYFNRVDPRALAGLVRTWPWLLAAFILMLPTFLVVSCRFKVILRNQGIHVSVFQALRWTMIGSFFDLALPTSCGGDLVKAGYLAKQVGAGQKAQAVMAVAFDRMLGMLGLFLLASLVSCFGWDMLRGMPARNTVLGLTIGASLGTLLFLRMAGSRRLYRNSILARLLSQQPWGLRVRQFITCFNTLSEHPRYLFLALGLSVLNHAFWCASLFCLLKVVGASVDPVKGLVVFPLAIFSNTFGVAGGFGGGTAGFDLIFSQLLAISNGALIGLLFQTLAGIARLAGLPFYLSSTSSGKAAS
jgi:uncharacterized protein (TIRG00374 family)